jgi:hypothetical protein
VKTTGFATVDFRLIRAMLLFQRLLTRQFWRG